MNDARFDPDDYQYGPRTTVVLEPNTKELIISPGLENLSAILKSWDGAHRADGFDPLPTLTSIAEIIEHSIDDFLKLDPDPLDDRHPARSHPHAEFGNLLKMLFRNDDFMNKEPSDFIPQLYVWAKDSSSEILRAYAIGLLAGALEVQGNAHKYRLNNIDLMPVALRRLTELKARMLEEMCQTEQEQQDLTTALERSGNSPGPFSNVNGFDMEDTSSLLNLAIEGHAMDLILEYIDLKKIHDIRLTFDALRYLTSLLVHRKFAMEFIARGGVVALLRVPRASMASVAAITALYYMSYNDDVMEKMCQLSEKVLDDVVE
nr:unnamed protein product [Haemonchus contortus]